MLQEKNSIIFYPETSNIYSLRKNPGPMYVRPLSEISAMEASSILCQSDVSGDISIDYHNPYGGSETVIP